MFGSNSGFVGESHTVLRRTFSRISGQQTRFHKNGASFAELGLRRDNGRPSMSGELKKNRVCKIIAAEARCKKSADFNGGARSELRTLADPVGSIDTVSS